MRVEVVVATAEEMAEGLEGEEGAGEGARVSKKDLLVGLKMFSAMTGAEGREGEERGGEALADEEVEEGTVEQVVSRVGSENGPETHLRSCPCPSRAAAQSRRA